MLSSSVKFLQTKGEKSVPKNQSDIDNLAVVLGFLCGFMNRGLTRQFPGKFWMLPACLVLQMLFFYFGYWCCGSDYTEMLRGRGFFFREVGATPEGNGPIHHNVIDLDLLFSTASALLSVLFSMVVCLVFDVVTNIIPVEAVVNPPTPLSMTKELGVASESCLLAAIFGGSISYLSLSPTKLCIEAGGAWPLEWDEERDGEQQAGSARGNCFPMEQPSSLAEPLLPPAPRQSAKTKPPPPSSIAATVRSAGAPWRSRTLALQNLRGLLRGFGPSTVGALLPSLAWIVFDGSVLLSYTPKFWVSGLLMHLAFGYMLDGTVDARPWLTSEECLIVVVIILAGTLVDITSCIFFGCSICCVLFVVRYSSSHAGTTVCCFTSEGDAGFSSLGTPRGSGAWPIHSAKHRTRAEFRFLRERPRSILIVRPSASHIFFASVGPMMDRVIAKVKSGIQCSIARRVRGGVFLANGVGTDPSSGPTCTKTGRKRVRPETRECLHSTCFPRERSSRIVKNVLAENALHLHVETLHDISTCIARLVHAVGHQFHVVPPLFTKIPRS